MSNLSCADGTYTLRSKSLDTIKDFVHLINTYLDRGDYYTTLCVKENTYQNAKVGKDGIYTVQIDFDGSGRWSYETNIACMVKWLENNLNLHGSAEDKIIFTKLLESDLKVEIDFHDVDLCQDMDYCEKVEFPFYGAASFTVL